MRKPNKLGRAWEQGIVGGPDRQVLYESLGRCGTNSHSGVHFRSHARVLPIQIESLGRKPGNETGMEFDLTGTMTTEDWKYWVEGWYNAETGMGHLILWIIHDELEKKWPPLDPGTRVRTTQLDVKMSGEYTKGGLESKQWGVEGIITEYHDSHGLCYGVEHQDGSVGHYEPTEIEVI